MLKKFLFFSSIALFVSAIGCKAPKDTTSNNTTTTTAPATNPITLTKEVLVHDTVVVAQTKSYSNANPSYTRRNDLIHTKLDVKFNWEKQYLYGKATLTLKPLFYPTDTLELDAKNFDIKKVSILNGSSEKFLRYGYNNSKLIVQLDRVYKSNEQYNLYIEYTAKPNEAPVGGSEAITSDKGLYFINPLGEDPDKPKQIWTQGETESSSRWFPTIDKPNERCTEEIYITVEDKYKTLSNGLMKSSTKNDDGTRTDYWVMDKPHAPYLFMMAIGEFSVTEDKCTFKDGTTIPVYYYVEPKFGPYAKQIYNHTPEILNFFSDRLGVKYPWSKMAHIIVRDYVSGAMENTTAIIYGEFCQKTDKELEDDPNDGIIAHEMFHHWFGDYVTCESWSNLTVNESFANYSEYLWLEYKYGKDQADRHLEDDLQGYLAQARNNAHDLVYFDYKDKEDMFDAHSYNKGGCILNMLRHYLGDGAFFAGLKNYLEKKALSSGEAHDLRLSFEEVCGEDLNWFFNQWYYSAGHPELEVQYGYDAATHKATVTVEQKQNLTKSPVFKLPLSVDVYIGDKATRHKITVTKQKQTFSFPSLAKPKLMVFDAEKILVGTIKESKDISAYIHQYKYAKEYLARVEALNNLQGQQENADAKTAIFGALSDKYWGLRQQALEYIELNVESDKVILNKIASMAQNDEKSQVRAAAFNKLRDLEAKGFNDIAVHAFENEPSYNVVGAALDYIYVADPAAALMYAEKLAKLDNESILITVSELYANSGDTKYLPFFEKSMKKMSGYSQIVMINNYVKLLSEADDSTISTGVESLHSMALDKNVPLFGRFGATNGIKTIGGIFKTKGNTDLADKMKALIKEIKEKESDPVLKQYYTGF